MFSNTITTGIYLFNPIIFHTIKDITFSPRGELEIADAIKKLLEQDENKVYGVLFNGWRKNISRPKDLLDTNREVLMRIHTRTHLTTPDYEIIEDGCQIGRNRKIIPPVVIGENARIDEHTEIGPYVTIGRNATIGAHSVISNSIIFDNAYVSERTKIRNTIYLNREVIVKV